jgi:hypothetical protein
LHGHLLSALQYPAGASPPDQATPTAS